MILMGVVDTVMAGQVSSFDLAALAIALAIWNPVILTLLGVVLALTGIIAHHFGAKQFNEIRSDMYQGFYLALMLCVFGFVVLNYVEIPLAYIDMDPQVEQLAVDYLNFVKWGLLGFLIYNVLRCVCEGMAYTKPAVYIAAIGLAINIPANYIFIHGKLGFDAYGSAGCGIATAIVTWIMAFSLFIYIFYSKRLKGRFLFSNIIKPNFISLLTITKLGTPIALAHFFEVTLFACIPLFIAPLGAVAVSGHQVAASVSTVLFMIPLSLALAICIRVGNLAGQKNYIAVKSVASTSLKLAAIISAFVAAITFLCRDVIGDIYSDDPEVVALASSILILACFYQLPDALQVASTGIMRGLKYTAPISYITFVSYWLIGFTLGYVLALTDWIVEPLGPRGFWLGIIVGLSVAATLLIYSVRRKLAQAPYNFA
jgi:MATE family multidrug resistance protein